MPSHSRRWLRVSAAAVVAGIAGLTLAPGAANAASYVPIAGAGSTWAQNAVAQWARDVNQYGMTINYAGTGSSDGRRQFLNGTTDFAVSDIPFQLHPEDGSAPENPTPGTYAYMPVVAGGTTFMYNLHINGQRVTNLRLSGTNVAKIFTGVIKTWNDPAIKADNPSLALPARTIVPVVRSDGSGSTAQFSLWMISQQDTLWKAYCQRVGRGSSCGETSYYPTIPGMIAQAGDLGVAGYITQSYAEGAIGYVNYSYALNAHFPVAKVLNRANYYTQPTATNVAVSLVAARVNTTDHDPAVYLTQDLSGVYNNADPRTYELSSYSYFILPTAVQGIFNTQKGNTLGAFSYYFMCAGQAEAASLGYSPLPINLVQAGFEQIRHIPGVNVQSIVLSNCHNPTFSPDGHNALLDNAPYPSACDKLGVTQCASGTGGATQNTTTTSTTRAAGPAATVKSTGPAAAATGPAAAATGAASQVCDPETGLCGGGTVNGQQVAATALTVPTSTGWSSTQTLMVLAAILVLGLVLAPPLISRRLSGREGR